MNILFGVVLCLAGMFGGGILSFLVSKSSYRKQLANYEAKKDEEIAWRVVLAMSTQHPARDSQELHDRVDEYLDALNEAKKAGRGVPVYRADGLIEITYFLRHGDYSERG